jgi:hypothetical protein
MMSYFLKRKKIIKSVGEAKEFPKEAYSASGANSQFFLFHFNDFSFKKTFNISKISINK